jgi:hypothetical protein
MHRIGAQLVTIITLLAACSRTASVEPVPLPDHIRVTFPMGEGVEHEITDPTVLARVQVLMNADLDGWRDISGFGKDPIPHAHVVVEARGQRTLISVGDSWLQRDKWYKEIPVAREKELFGLVGGKPMR